jgi:hypothetical protein
VFKTVTSVRLDVFDEGERNLIIDGIVSGVEAILVSLADEVDQLQRAAVGCLRDFAALKKIRCSLGLGDTALPPFIPPSLEHLSLETDVCDQPVLLLGCLPPMIKSSGAKLRRLDLDFESLDAVVARGVRSVLQACASTLKMVTLMVDVPFESAVEVMEGLASCQHLERVEAPISTFAVMPPGGTTFRLVHLRLSLSYSHGDAHRALSSLELWGLMARGGSRPCPP